MRNVTNMAAQGDVLFRRVEKIPESAKREETNGPVIVAHSETGHHHTVDGVHLWREPGNEMICYLQMGDSCDFADVVHHRPYDTHETLRLLGGPWEVRRQREHTPEGWRRVED